ncbi:hypothetical protein B9479_004025 [Cryptococcus floricola]|uniref:MIT domain-containing protein n=1 Tax=Cryptococcus floricola TaxID=2591691 RepID=A0A5D3AWQ6_9TREE|nr:hypothetical protein B9479_004025 [Cryptococcus floricola]
MSAPHDDITPRPQPPLPSTPPRSYPPSLPSAAPSDGFLGDVAKWQETRSPSEGGAGGSAGKSSVRTSRMINKFGASPPPPPGPPRKSSCISPMLSTDHPCPASNPPPLPPPSAHPFASMTNAAPASSSLGSAAGRRTSTQIPPARQSTINALRPSGRPSSPGRSRVHSHGSPSKHHAGLAASPIPASHASTSASTTSTARTSKPPRTPSRLLLQTALDLAQKAVEMDRSNDVAGALAAYREAVSRLKSVMERVGLEDDKKKEKEKKGMKAEEEGRTLKGIHDAYVARIQLLTSYDGVEGAEGTEGSEDGTVVPAGVSASGSSPVLETLDEGKEGSIQASDEQGVPAPRSSFDEATQGIGELMLGPSSPENHTISLETPPLSGGLPEENASPRLPRIDGQGDISLQQALDRVAGSTNTPFPKKPPSLPASNPRSIGLGHPSHSPSQSFHYQAPHASHSSHARTMSMDSNGTSSSLSPSSRRFRRHKASLGLDMEADLSGIDGVAPVGVGIGFGQGLGPGDVEVLATTPTERMMPQVQPALSLPSDRASPAPSMGSDERPLPPLPPSAGLTSDQRRRSGSVQSQNGLGISAGQGFLVSPSTKQGTISQRRRSRPSSGALSIEGIPERSHTPSQEEPRKESRHASRRASISSLISGRARAKSQPGGRPGDPEPLPPVPSTTGMRHQPSFSISSQMSLSLGQGIGQGLERSTPVIQQPNPLLQQMGMGMGLGGMGMGRSQGLRINTAGGPGLVPPTMTSRSGSINSLHPNSPRSLPPLPSSTPSPSALGTATPSHASYSSTSLLSPLPEPQPAEESLRPFHILRLLRQSMDGDNAGCYLTPGLHITPAVWNPSTWSRSAAIMGGTEQGDKFVPKIVAQDIKTRCMATLAMCLETLKGPGFELLSSGPRDRSRPAGAASTPVSPGARWQKAGEELVRALDELEEEIEGVSKMLSKGGVGVGGWKGKKGVSTTKSWGSRISRGMDKISNNKHLDTPDKYVDNLAYLCTSSQVLSDHLTNILGPQCTPGYAELPEKTFREVEVRARRAGDFIRLVVLPFVLEDFRLFLLRYLKGGVRYLED